MNSRITLSAGIAALVTVFGTALSLAQSATLTGNPHPTWPQLNPVTRLTAETFAHPPITDRPWVRVNTPADVTSEELTAEIAEMKQHGIGGIEIGQGTFPKTPQLIAILKAANAQGLKVSLSHGSTAAPEGYSFDKDNVRKTLLYTASSVNAGAAADITLKAPLPPVNRGFGGGRAGGAPPPPPPPRRSTLIAVMAYKCAAACASTGPITLDQSSVIDLTSKLTGTNTSGVGGGTTTGNLKWTAPAGGQWQVIAFWSQGANAQPDLFSKAGTDELIAGMEADWTPEVKSLLKANGGDIFYDSHSADRGSPTETWTNNMEAEFKARKGYSLIANAPALFDANFAFSDGSAPRIHNDLNEVRTTLWIEKHLKPMEAWAHSFNYRIRLQPYGEQINTTPDAIEAAAILDRPETESLFFGDEIDSFLTIASANHITGNTWYSTECCAALNKAYAQTFQDAVIRMHREYAAGVTKLVYHVYPYRDSSANKWPGYHSFGNAGFSNAWGPRNPFWGDANTYNDYFARTQQVLTQGDAKVDVAVFMQSYTFPQPMQIKGGFHIWPDTKLQEAGFTRDYVDPALLAMPGATVTAGRLAAGKAAYKALIIDREQQPADYPVKSSMPLATAKRILTMAKAGLPIVIVGGEPDTTSGNTPKDDAALQSIMGEMVKLKNVHQVAHEGDVPALLLSLNIHPAMEPKSSSPIISLHRHDAAKAADFYFLYNQAMITPPNEPTNLFEPASDKAFNGDVHLQGAGKPYMMDAWSGKITPIKDFTPGNGGVTVHLNLTGDDAAIIALSTTPMGTAASALVKTTAAPIDLTNAKWHLSVEDWKPANPFGAAGAQGAETSKQTVALDIDGLKPWTQIAQIKDASGIGTYTTIITLPADWKTGTAATLKLGEVFDSFKLTINGQVVPINQISATTEVGPYLKAGSNSVEVRVATTLNNRLAAVDPDVKKRNLEQAYGLIGPVTLTPHQ